MFNLMVFIEDIYHIHQDNFNGYMMLHTKKGKKLLAICPNFHNFCHLVGSLRKVTNLVGILIMCEVYLVYPIMVSNVNLVHLIYAYVRF